jgi:hypothetical protein
MLSYSSSLNSSETQWLYQKSVAEHGFAILRGFYFVLIISCLDRLCGLLDRVLGYRFGGPGSILGTTIKKVVGLELGPLSLVSTTEELLDRKVAAPV